MPQLKPIRTPSGRSRSFLRHERGATIVEFALLAPIFFAILAAILETAMIFLSSQVFESAVNDTARAIRTGEAQSAGWTLETFRAGVCGRLYSLISDCSKIHFEVTEIADFQSGEVTAPVDWTCTEDCDWTRDPVFRPGSTSSTVLVQAHYKYPVILQVAGFGAANLPTGERLIGAATVFRNEPF